MKRFDHGVTVMFVDDPVRVGRYPLFGRRVKVISARVILVGRTKVDRMLLKLSFVPQKS